MAPPAHQGDGVALVVPLAHRLVHGFFYPGIAVKIPLDKVRRLVAADPDVPGQAKFADAVHQAEIHRFGGGAHFLGHILHRHAVHLRRRAGVDILALLKGVHHGGVAGKVGHHPQLDLAVIRVGQHAAGPGDESLADLPAHFGAHRDVLQVGLAGGNAARGGAGLVKIGVYPAGRVHFAQQGVDVSAVQLHHLPVFEDRRNAGVLVLELFQGVRVGGIAPLGLFPVGQVQILKQHLAQLLGAVQVKAPYAGEAVHFFLQFFRFFGKLRAQGGKHVPVHLEARLLHPEEHVQQRHFHFPHAIRPALLLKLPFLLFSQGHNAHGVLPGEIGQGVGFFLRIVEIRTQHGVPGKFRHGQAPVRQLMEQGFAVVHVDFFRHHGPEGRPGLLRRHARGQHIHLKLDFPKPPRHGQGHAGGRHVQGHGPALPCLQESGDGFRRRQGFLGKFFLRFPFRGGGGRRAGQHFFQPARHAVQLVFAQRGQPFRHAGYVEGSKIEGNGRSGPDGGQILAEPGQVGVVPHLFPQLALAFAAVGQHVFQGAVFVQQLQRGFFAHAWNAGDVVAGVAHQALPVGHLFGGDAEIFLHARGVKKRALRDALAGEEHPGVFAHQLQSVPVAGQQHAVQAAFPAFQAQRAQNIVGFVSFRR